MDLMAFQGERPRVHGRSGMHGATSIAGFTSLSRSPTPISKSQQSGTFQWQRLGRAFIVGIGGKEQLKNLNTNNQHKRERLP